MYSIIGLAELLLKEGYGSLNEDQRGVVGRIIDGAKGMRGLVNTFLEHAQLDSGEFQLEISNGEVSTLLKEVEEASKAWLKGSRVDFSLDCNTLIPSVSTDWNLVRQIVYNLVSNAVQNTSEGSVVLSAEYDELCERVEIRVSDTGGGISKERLDEIFFPFRPVEQDVGDGNRSGLSLAINKLQAAAIGGEIEVKSNEGKGSVFTLLLPLSLRGDSAEPFSLSESALQ